MTLAAAQPSGPACPVPEASPLALAHAALGAADQAAAAQAAAGAAPGASADAYIAALLGGVRALGFDRALVVARDARGEDAGLWTSGEAAPPAFGAAVWRRWVRLLDRRRADPAGAAGWWFDLATDAWARAEFGELFGIATGARAEARAGERDARGLLLAAAPDAGDGVRVVLAAERGGSGATPAPDVLHAAALLVRAAAGHLGRARLEVLAAARAERLQLLHEAGVALARSLDEGEVVRELARQVARLVAHDGLVVAHPDVERGLVRTALRLVRGLARPRPELPLGAGPVGEAARTGAPVRVDDYDPARSPLAAADDVVGDAGPARSVLAVPMRVGTRLVGVLALHAAAPGAFGDADLETLRTVAAQAAVALGNARAFAESEAERRQSDALVALARAVGGSLRPGEVLRLGLRHTLALLGAEGAFVALVHGAHLQVVAGAGSAELFAGAHLAVADTLPGRAVAGVALGAEPGGALGGDALAGDALGAGGAPAAVIDNRVPEAGHAAFPLHDVAPVEKLVAAPLVTADGAVGVLAAVNRAADFGPADARVLGRLAELLAVAAVNARLFARVEEATREWRVAFDATGAGMAVVDADGRVARANVRAAELLAGAPSPQALLGRDFVALVCGAAPDDAAAGAASAPFADGLVAGAGALRRALGDGGRRRGRVRAAPAAGAARVFEVLLSPHPAGGVVATFDDVTAQVAFAERYARVVEAAADGIVTLDAEGRLTSANAALAAAVGAPIGRLLGRHYADLVDPRDRARVEELVAAAVRGERARGEVRYRDYGGRSCVASLAMTPVTAPDGAPGALCVARDVTGERRTAEQLVQREKLAAMGELVSGVAHELNNPLAGVLALSELLLAEPVVAAPADEAVEVDAPARRELREVAAAVHREARRAARTVARLLDFARQHAPRRAAADVNRALVDALDLRRSSLRLAGVDLALELDYELPAAWADAHQLQQVFLNLIANAEYALAAHAGPRRLTLRTRAARAPAAARPAGGAPNRMPNSTPNGPPGGSPRGDAPWIAVEVSDSGPGLADGEAARVFEPFYTTKPEGAGTGLGLAVSAGIVREHGGVLRVESAPGAGATFVVELPAGGPADGDPADGGPAGEGPADGAGAA